MKIEIFYEDSTAVAVEAYAAHLNIGEKELKIRSKVPIKSKYAKEIYINESNRDPLAVYCNDVIDESGRLLVTYY